MANLDTTAKRRSSAHVLQPYSTPLPVPTGSIDQGTRQHIIWVYSGILAELIVSGQPVMIRTFGIPTGTGRRDRPGGWN